MNGNACNGVPYDGLHSEAEICVGAGPREPRVTVVIPNYNGAETLARAIQSVLCQSLDQIELIIVDDASTDQSWSLIENAADEDIRVRPIRNPRNSGKPVGMNRAIKLARGKWFAVLDADDWYERERLALLVQQAERHDVDLIADNQFLFDAGAGQLVGTAWPAGANLWELTCDGFLAGSSVYETFNLGMLKPVVKTGFLRAEQFGYDETARHGHDFLHLLRFFCAGGRAAVSDAPQYYYTQPYGAVSRRWSHIGRRRYDFRTTQRVNQELLCRFSQKLTRGQTSALRRRNRQMLSLEHFHQLKEAIAAHDIAAAAALGLLDPAVLAYVFRRLCERGRTRRPNPIVSVARRARKFDGSAMIFPRRA